MRGLRLESNNAAIIPEVRFLHVSWIWFVRLRLYRWPSVSIFYLFNGLNYTDFAMSTGDELLPPLLPVTDDNHGAWVITVSTLLLILTTFIATVTLVSRVRVLRTLSWSDTFLCIATV